MSFGRISSLLEFAMLEDAVKAINDSSTGVSAELNRSGQIVLELTERPHTQIVLETKR